MWSTVILDRPCRILTLPNPWMAVVVLVLVLVGVAAAAAVVVYLHKFNKISA